MSKEPVKKTCSMYRGQPSESAMSYSGFMVYKLAQYVQETFEEFFGDDPVKARHFLVLRVLAREGAMTQQQICNALWIDRATMVGVVQALLDLEYLKKRDNPEDKRSHLVSITAKGERFYERHVEEFEALDHKIFSGFQGDEMKAFRAMLRKAMAELQSR